MYKKRMFWLLLILVMGYSIVWAAETVGPWVKIIELEQTDSTMAGFFNERIGYKFGEDGISDYTVDGGKTWIRGKNESMNRYGLDILNETTAWSCGDGKQVRVTHDGGKTWIALTDFGYFAPDVHHSELPRHSRFLSFVDVNHGWISGLQNLASTQDGGKTWIDLKLPNENVQIAAIALRTPEEGYILDAQKNGFLYITKNSGKTWAAYPVGLKGENLPLVYTPMAAMRFSDSNHGMIVINRMGGLIYALRTIDAGHSWMQEQVPGNFGGLYLAPDGKTLTINGVYQTIMVLHRK